MTHHTAHEVRVEPYIWTFADGRQEDGYRIDRNGHFLWLGRQDAYDVCCALAELIDADNAAAEPEGADG